MSSDLISIVTERARIVRELEVVNRALAKATVANGHQGASRSQPSKASSGKVSRGKRRSWFERGEAPALLKKFATKPRTQADLMRAVAAAKGYDKGLSAADSKRVQSAVYQAIANAVASKKLVASKDGTVRAAR